MELVKERGKISKILGKFYHGRTCGNLGGRGRRMARRPISSQIGGNADKRFPIMRFSSTIATLGHGGKSGREHVGGIGRRFAEKAVQLLKITEKKKEGDLMMT